MLNLHEVIPPLTARTPTGDPIHAWDFKQRKNLVIAFLHSRCGACDRFLDELCARAKDLAEHEAVTLAIFTETPPRATLAKLPPEVLAAADSGGLAQRVYLEEDVRRPERQRSVGVFVTDRYGELYAQWIGREPQSLPRADVVFDCLRQIELTCDEDGVTPFSFAA
jgi:peroxiredoxin